MNPKASFAIKLHSKLRSIIPLVMEVHRGETYSVMIYQEDVIKRRKILDHSYNDLFMSETFSLQEKAKTNLNYCVDHNYYGDSEKISEEEFYIVNLPGKEKLRRRMQAR